MQMPYTMEESKHTDGSTKYDNYTFKVAKLQIQIPCTLNTVSTHLTLLRVNDRRESSQTEVDGSVGDDSGGEEQEESKGGPKDQMVKKEDC